MRRRIISTAAGIVLLTMLLIPLASMLSTGQKTLDAEHMIQPMLDLLEQSPQAKAHVPVGPMMDMEAVWDIEDMRQEAQTPLVCSMRNGEHELGLMRRAGRFSARWG